MLKLAHCGESFCVCLCELSVSALAVGVECSRTYNVAGTTMRSFYPVCRSKAGSRSLNRCSTVSLMICSIKRGSVRDDFLT